MGQLVFTDQEDLTLPLEPEEKAVTPFKVKLPDSLYPSDYPRGHKHRTGY